MIQKWVILNLPKREDRGFKYTVSIDIPPLWGEERH